MADHFTTRLALPYPDIDDPADVPADMQQLAERLDLLIPAGSGAGLVLNRAAVLDVGMAGQVRAGRQLTAADFTALGLGAPRGLWNLGDLTDASGNGRALTNKGAVTFANGINGAATTAAQFTGSTAQALYISDTGAADPFRIATGSWGCWCKTAKRASGGTYMMSKLNPATTDAAWALREQGNVAMVSASVAGTPAAWVGQAVGVTDICDDRWHFVVGTFDATTIRLYVDAVLEATQPTSGALNPSAGPLNISGFGGDAGNPAASPSFGRVDEAFVTADVLSDDQVRNLYCARLPHTLGLVPSAAKLNVTRRRRGSAWAVADFPAQPLRLHNFTAGALADQGSGNVPLAVAAGAPLSVAGADGALGGGYHFNGSSSLGATDAGLPAALTARSYGCWFKTTSTAAQGIAGWGSAVGTGDARLNVTTGGAVTITSGADTASGTFVADGQWHFAVVVEDSAAGDGLKRKLYLDGRLNTASTVLNAIALGGANRFRIGALLDGTSPFTGQIDGAFVTDVALTGAQVLALWAKGAQALAPSPKNAGDHVEAWDAAAVYATFDTLDTNAQIDLGVAA
jgi:hypothetical protein